jgi:hypothetical protein
MKWKKLKKKLLNVVQENTKNVDNELLSMLEDLLVQGVEMEVMEVVEVEEEVVEMKTMTMLILRMNTKKKRLNNPQTMVVVIGVIMNVVSLMRRGLAS